MNSNFIKVMCLFFVLFSGQSLASRYSLLSLEPTIPMIDPLSNTVNISLGPFTTVRSALNKYLKNSGYKLASRSASDPKLNQLLNKIIPKVHRKMGKVRLNAGLAVLAGYPWRLVVDPVHRLVSFERFPYFLNSISFRFSNFIKSSVNSSMPGEDSEYELIFTKANDL